MATKAKVKLLPCPFCGSENVGDAPVETNSRVKAVFCGECHAEGPARTKAADAIAMWNQRAEPKWNGKCPAGEHGLDFKGQPCDLCPKEV